VLKSVVENQDIGIVNVDGLTSGCNAIGILQMYDSGAQLVEQQFFVVGYPVKRAVTSTQNDGVTSDGRKPVDQPGDNRRLACSARCQVPDADDRYCNLVLPLQTRIERFVSQKRNTSVTERENSETAAAECCRKALCLAGNQSSKGGFIHSRLFVCGFV